MPNLIVLAGVATLLVGVFLGVGDVGTAMFFTVLGTSALVGGRIALREEDRFDTLAIRPEDAPMLPELGVASGFLVSMWVLQGHTVTGRDRGAMWIEGGRLLFSGRSMSFALTRQMVVGGWRDPRLGPGVMELALDHASDAGTLAVSFTPLFGDRPYAWEPKSLVASWLEQAGASSEAGQLPPTTVGPSADSPATIRKRIVGSILRESGYAGIVLLPLAVSGSMVPALAVVLSVGALVGYWGPLRRSRFALTDARRLAGLG